MEMSKRLFAVANEVGFDTMADIGTDHGYVPIYLAKKGRIKKAVACDIKKGPLEKAQKNIDAYAMGQMIETRLGNGLSPIAPYEVESIVIGGMGGMLMVDILKNSMDVVKSIKELILQPQLDLYEVRKYLHSIEFAIINEVMIEEDNKYYTIIHCVPGKEKYEQEKQYLFGKILLDRKDSVLKEFLAHEMNKNKNIIKTLSKAGTENAGHRRDFLNKIQSVMEEAYTCL